MRWQQRVLGRGLVVREGFSEVTPELQEVPMERSGTDRAFQVGEQGAVQGKGRGWAWRCFRGRAVRLLKDLSKERI